MCATENVKRPRVDELDSVNTIIAASCEAFCRYSEFSLNRRQEIIQAIKTRLENIVPEIAQRTVQETGMGNKRDKIIKLLLAIHKTPGIEDLITECQTGDNGMTLYELSAYGLVCAAHPCTNPGATMINNTIGMLAAGNAIIHVPHPRAIYVCRFVAEEINRAIEESCGIKNLVVCLEESSMGRAREVMSHPDVDLVVATGGGRMLRNALSCGKRVIGAGPANPVAIVDETADLDRAAADIVEGASFDHNIMCITEKNVVVVDAVADKFVEKLLPHNVHYVKDKMEMLCLSKAVLTPDLKVNRSLEGKSPHEILKAAGLQTNKNNRLIIVDTVRQHPFATEELLLPLIPMIRAANFENALDIAYQLEQGYRHTAILHSQSIERLNKAAKHMQTSIFVKNGSSLVGIGFNGEGSTSFTVASMTGEGITTARHFARRRRCTLTSGFSIR